MEHRSQSCRPDMCTNIAEIHIIFQQPPGSGFILYAPGATFTDTPLKDLQGFPEHLTVVTPRTSSTHPELEVAFCRIATKTECCTPQLFIATQATCAHGSEQGAHFWNKISFKKAAFAIIGSLRCKAFGMGNAIPSFWPRNGVRFIPVQTL